MARLLLSIFVSLFIINPTNAGSLKNGNDAEEFIKVLGAEVLNLAQNNSFTAQGRQQEFGKLIDKGFDLPWIARFVLGRPWNSATFTEQKEYLRLFKKIIELTYSKRFINYSQQRIVVTGHKLGKRKFIFVQSYLADLSHKKINPQVVWRLIPRRNSFKIVDVAIEGISMAITQRNEYASVIQQNGGRLSALLDAMRQQLQKLEKIT